MNLASTLLDTAYDYIKNPNSAQVAKLNHEFRPVFSSLVTFLKQIPFRVQLPEALAEIEKLPNPEVKEKAKALISEIYEKVFSKVKLIEAYKISESDRALFYVGNINGEVIVPLIASYKKTLKSFNWNLKVVISNTLLSKILRPEILLHFEWEDGELSFSVTLEQFQVIRKAIASMLLRIHALECIRQIDL